MARRSSLYTLLFRSVRKMAGKKRGGFFSILWVILGTLLVLTHYPDLLRNFPTSPSEPTERAVSGTLVGTPCDVRDGDTFYIREANGKRTKIRLQAIDAPERNQPGGLAAGKFLEQLLSDGEVRAEICKIDQYGRTVCHVSIQDRDVEEQMLRNGMAWHYKKYNTDPRLAAAEAAARAERVGIWADSPIPPWEWRHRR